MLLLMLLQILPKSHRLWSCPSQMIYIVFGSTIKQQELGFLHLNTTYRYHVELSLLLRRIWLFVRFWVRGSRLLGSPLMALAPSKKIKYCIESILGYMFNWDLYDIDDDLDAFQILWSSILERTWSVTFIGSNAHVKKCVNIWLCKDEEPFEKKDINNVDGLKIYSIAPCISSKDGLELVKNVIHTIRKSTWYNYLLRKTFTING